MMMMMMMMVMTMMMMMMIDVALSLSYSLDALKIKEDIIYNILCFDWLLYIVESVERVLCSSLQDVEYPESFSEDMKCLLAGLLCRDVPCRLGCKGTG